MRIAFASLAIAASSLVPHTFAFAQSNECVTSDCTGATEDELVALKKAQKKEQAAARLQRVATIAPITAPSPPVPIDQDYEPNPAIWKLSDDDTTIYMFGTFHLLPEGFRWRSPTLNTIVQQVDELVVETSDDDGDAQISELVGELVTQAMSPDRVSISERLSAGNREKWLSIADRAGLPHEFFDRMPLIFSMLGAGIKLAEEQGSLSTHGVETVLEAEFKAADKPIGSIEDSGDVMRALLAIDESVILEELDEELTKWDGELLDTLFTEEDESLQPGVEISPKPDKIDPFESEHAWHRAWMISWVSTNLIT